MEWVGFGFGKCEGERGQKEEEGKGRRAIQECGVGAGASDGVTILRSAVGNAGYELGIDLPPGWARGMGGPEGVKFAVVGGEEKKTVPI